MQYSTVLKQYDSKANVCSCKLKLAKYIILLMCILMCTELKYLKQGFPETLAVFVLYLKNNSFENS